MYSVYVLYSASFQVYYKGYTENINDRLAQHNAGLSRYTAGKGPWELIILESYSTKASVFKQILTTEFTEITKKMLVIELNPLCPLCTLC